MKGDHYNFNINEITCIQRELLRWYDINKRNLPWRNISCQDQNNHAYVVWVSEIMLQQTRVGTVIDYYNRWLQKWPTVACLSKASQDEVNQMWSGLGYYSRGTRLLDGAHKIMETYGGNIPTDSTTLMKTIPGVGRYTASAIASIVFNEVVGVLDGNVIRVLCRLRAIGGNISTKEVNSHLWSLSNALVDPHKPGDFNQAIMELGALICTPKNPSCLKCPLKSCCKAYAKVEAAADDAKLKLLLTDDNRQESNTATTIDLKAEQLREPEMNDSIDDIENCADFLALHYWNPALGVTNYPQKFNKKTPKTETKIVIIVELFDKNKGAWSKNQSKVLVSKRPKSGLLANLWEFPNKDQDKLLNTSKKRKRSDCSFSDADIDTEKVTTFISNLLGIVSLQSYKILSSSYVAKYLHKFSHIHQTSFIFTYKIVSDTSLETVTVPLGLSYQWVNLVEFDKLAKPTLTKKIYDLFKKFQMPSANQSLVKEKQVAVKRQASIKSFLKK